MSVVQASIDALLFGQMCIPSLLFVAFSKGLAETGVGAQVQRRLALLVTDGEVSSIGRQEASNRSCTLLLSPLSAQSHN